MKRIAIVLCLPLLLVACARSAPQREGAPRAELIVTTDAKPAAEIGSKPVLTSEPVATLASLLPDGHHEGVTVEVDGVKIIAVTADNAETETLYLVLDEAMKAGVCTIAETGDVNSLAVTNTGTQPVFLMAGDLVLGGQQDRILAESVVVDAGVTGMRIPVFCVEHGRWAVQSKDGALAETNTFTNTAGSGQADVNVKKQAIATQDQGEVWKQVADSNSALGLKTGSGTFRETYDDATMAAKIEEAYTRAAALSDGKIVGFAVVHEDEVVAMDLFDSTALAAKVSEKLLRSYIITAISSGYDLPLDRKLARQTITWQCSNEDARAAAGSLGRVLNLRISVDDSLQGNVSFDLEDADGVAAVTTLAESLNAVAVVDGSDVRLVPEAAYAQQQELQPSEDAPTFYGESTVDDDIPEQISGTTDLGRQGASLRTITLSEPCPASPPPASPPAPPAPGEPVPPPEAEAESAPPTETTPHAETPNERTVNLREYEKESVKYSCEDKKTGRKVQTSFLRR
jgi:hypothetical protein